MKDFFKTLFAVLLGLALFCGAGFGLLVMVGASLASSSAPRVPAKSVLIFDLATSITDGQPDVDPATALREAVQGNESKGIALTVVLDALDRAAKDPRIAALYLEGNVRSQGYASGYATLKEVREAIERFRNTGKPVLAYNMGWSKKDYYLGSAASTLYVNPFGSVEFNGMGAQPMFFAGFLKKYGVEVQVTRVGKYKSAVEPFLLEKMSPENREQIQGILGDVWKEYLVEVGKGRKLSPEALQALADERGIFTAAPAKEKGLVDRVAYMDEVLLELKKLTGKAESDKSFPQIALANYADAAPKAAPVSKNRVAVVYAEGDIVDGEGESAQIGGDRLARRLRELRQDAHVKAVVLRVNSPGGSASASEVIQREIRLIREKKPVIVSMGTVAASGGYWISAYGDRIFAEPNTITGSIGVFGLLTNFKKLAGEHGVTFDSVQTAKYASLGSSTRPQTEEELKLIQGFVDEIYEAFLTKVAEGRKLDRSRVHEIAQGRVWSGAKALELGLVDELGGLQAAIRCAAEKAKLGSDYKVDEPAKPKPFFQKLLDSMGEGEQPKKLAKQDPFMVQVERLKAEFKTLSSMNDPKGVYARLPYSLNLD